MFQKVLFFIIFVLLWIDRIDAQEEEYGDIIIISKRVGKVIDPEERKEFNLFPAIKGFKSAIFLKSVNGSYFVKITYIDDTTGKEKIKKFPRTEANIMRYKSIIDPSVDIQEVKNETSLSSKQKYSPWSVVFFTFGRENFTGGVTNTLNSGFLGQLCAVEYTPPKATFLNFCLIWIETGDYAYKFTSEEKQLIKERYVITSKNNFNIPAFGESEGEPIDPEEDLKLSSTRASLNVTLSPMIGPLRPFIGFGVGIFNLRTEIDGDNNPGTRTQSYYKIGADIYPCKYKQSLQGLFLRVEYVNGSVPDWSVRMLKELRPIRGGHFEIFRFGIGLSMGKFGVDLGEI